MKKILITGKEGQVGWELQHILAPFGQILACDRNVCDLGSKDSIIKVVRDFKPHIIVNAAAYTAVDKAEAEPDAAMAINGDAPGILAEEAKKLNALIVHYSTDYVFNGEKNNAYNEDDAPQPLNVYGQSKLAGEQSISQAYNNHIILRTSWVYGIRGKNFLLTMLKLAKERDQLKIVNDQFGAPTWSRMIARATAQILACNDVQNGIFHLTASGKTTWFDFAKRIFEMVDNRTIKVMPIPAKDYPLPAQRPVNSVLSNKKIMHAYDLQMPNWDESLLSCLKNETA